MNHEGAGQSTGGVIRPKISSHPNGPRDWPKGSAPKRPLGSNMFQHRSLEFLMPRFFFDITMGRRRARDDSGIELVSEQIACEQARAVLPDIVRDCSCTKPEPIMLQVRNESGATVYVGRRVIQPKGLHSMLLRCVRTIFRIVVDV